MLLINFFFIIIIGVLLGVCFIFILRKGALKSRLLISGSVTVVGGIALVIAFFISYLLGLWLFRIPLVNVIGIFFASAILFLFGLIDDFRELSIVGKFLVQIIATTVLVISGVCTQIVSIGPVLNILITFIWVIGITNAFNHLDVLDGLAGSSALVISLAFFIISFLNADMKTMILSLALSAALCGFLSFNLPPAKIYMGNGGSHFLGFVLAATAIMISYAPLERKIALLSPIVILGFPILDTAFLIILRLKKKILPFKKSKDHLALRFLISGYSKEKALLLMVVWVLFYALCGALLSQVSNAGGIIIFVLVISLSLLLTKKMAKVQVDG
jgi:UDP-GlcNAc:undecaprenyl-phosphate GlcNAc-1-phosphate transferase